jgi:hypothetical protein
MPAVEVSDSPASVDPTDAEAVTKPFSTRSGQLGAVVGLAGLGVGVSGLVIAQPVLGLIAGILALLGPMVILRTTRPAPSSIDSMGAVELATSEPSAPVPAQQSPFHGAGELLTADYFHVAVHTRVTAARRFLKPLAVVQMYLGLAEGCKVSDDPRITEALSQTLRDCDTACVISDNQLALILEDTPETGAVWAVERIRRTLVDIDSQIGLWAGIACYPAHGMEADEVMSHAVSALPRAQEWPQGRIEVAYSD